MKILSLKKKRATAKPFDSSWIEISRITKHDGNVLRTRQKPSLSGFNDGRSISSASNAQFSAYQTAAMKFKSAGGKPSMSSLPCKAFLESGGRILKQPIHKSLSFRERVMPELKQSQTTISARTGLVSLKTFSRYSHYVAESYLRDCAQDPWSGLVPFHKPPFPCEIETDSSWNTTKTGIFSLPGSAESYRGMSTLRRGR